MCDQQQPEGHLVECRVCHGTGRDWLSDPCGNCDGTGKKVVR